MCISAAVAASIAAVATVAGTAVSIGATNASAAQQKLALDMEKKQLQEEREVARAQAVEAETERVSDYERNRAANLATMAATGTRSESFLQGIEKASEKALSFDLANIRTGFLQTDIAAQRGIRVNRMNRQAVGIAAGLQKAGAVVGAVSDLTKIGQQYSKTKTG
jgi:hypothetical protein